MSDPLPADMQVLITEGLHPLSMNPNKVCVWTGEGGLILAATGLPDTEAAITDALRPLGWDPSGVIRVVLTHWHADQSGAAAAVATWDAQVCAGQVDASVICGEAAVSCLRSRRRNSRCSRSSSRASPRRSCAPCTASSTTRLDIEGTAAAVATPGAMAAQLTRLGMALTGDTVAGQDGRLVRGPFDTAAARRLLHYPASLEADVVGVGRGDLIFAHANALPRRAAEQVDADQTNHVVRLGGARHDGRGGSA